MVKKHILAKPSRLRMSNWLLRSTRFNRIGRYFTDLSTKWGEPEKQLIPDCGTVGCIAGWAQMLSGEKGKPSEESAGSLLDISPICRLFYVTDWPDQFRDRYLRATTQRQRAKIVGQVIDDFIATDGWQKESV